MLRTLPLTAALVWLGCAGSGAPRPDAGPQPPVPGHEILWVRDSAEYHAAVIQTYKLAEGQLDSLTRGLGPGRWAVILDADETVISNLDYSLERAAVGERWGEESWQEWVQSRKATALPGALEFIDAVRRRGGRIAIVTNRIQEHCPATRENLEIIGVRFDVLKCRDGERHKEGRWEAVRNGDGTGLGPLEIVMWIGDNILDFPGMDQSSKDAGDGAYTDFGVRYFILPNPLYGSWEPESE